MFTQVYATIVNYAIGGGAAAVVLFILLYRKANSVASKGNKAKMATFSLAPAALATPVPRAAAAQLSIASDPN